MTNRKLEIGILFGATCFLSVLSCKRRPAVPYASDLPIRNPQPKIRNRNGGIAQLVERQLCKLEVRGSNPLASRA
jgi:hypothetical protein